MITCIAIDLDNTLIYPRGGNLRLFRVLAKHGVPLLRLPAIYEEAKQHGLSAHSLLAAAKTHSKKPLDAGAIQNDIARWLHASVACYPDSIAAVTEWRKRRVPVMIVTVGVPEFQKEKIAIAGIPHDDVFVVQNVNGKSSVLGTLLDRYGATCLFIDDKSTELDAAYESGIAPERVLTFRIRRRNSPYYQQKAVYEHRHITRLDDPIIIQQLTV